MDRTNHERIRIELVIISRSFCLRRSLLGPRSSVKLPMTKPT